VVDDVDLGGAVVGRGVDTAGTGRLVSDEADVNDHGKWISDKKARLSEWLQVTARRGNCFALLACTPCPARPLSPSAIVKECQEKGVLAACPIPSSLDLTDLTLGMGIPSNVVVSASFELLRFAGLRCIIRARSFFQGVGVP